MGEVKTLNVSSELMGMAVLRSDTGERLGEVADVVVHPTEGSVLGISVRTPEDTERVLYTMDFSIGADAVMAAEGARFDDEELTGALAKGVYALSELIGTNIVTQNGRLLGRISEVHVSIDTPRAIYRVAGSTMQRFFGRGFFISGDVPHAYSHQGVRLIVPANTEDHSAVQSLREAITGRGRTTPQEEAGRS